MHIQECSIDINGLRTRYLTAGSGPALILLHGAGENAIDWQWVFPALTRRHCVYALDLPGYNGAVYPRIGYSPAFFAGFVVKFMTILGIKQAAIIGNSLGGLIGIHMALAVPTRVTALGLVDSVGLGRAVHPVMVTTVLPGYGDLAVLWGQTPLGALQRASLRVPLMFARPERAPTEWFMEQYRLAQLPYFLRVTLNTLRAQVGLQGQREVVLDQLANLRMPTLIVWGEHDLVIPADHARDAVKRLSQGHLALIPHCGHLPHVEQPEQFAALLGGFLAG